MAENGNGMAPFWEDASSLLSNPVINLKLQRQWWMLLWMAFRDMTGQVLHVACGMLSVENHNSSRSSLDSFRHYLSKLESFLLHLPANFIPYQVSIFCCLLIGSDVGHVTANRINTIFCYSFGEGAFFMDHICCPECLPRGPCSVLDSLWALDKFNHVSSLLLCRFPVHSWIVWAPWSAASAKMLNSRPECHPTLNWVWTTSPSCKPSRPSISCKWKVNENCIMLCKMSQHSPTLIQIPCLPYLLPIVGQTISSKNFHVAPFIIKGLLLVLLDLHQKPMQGEYNPV